MAKRPKRLTESFIEGLTGPGIHGDGRGGYGLKVRAHRTVAGHLTRSWVQQVRIDGKVTALGLGRWPLVSLKAARILAMENAVKLHRGIDPRTRSRAVRIAPAAPVAVLVEAPAPTGPTFRAIFETVIEDGRGNWKNGVSEAKRRAALAALAFADNPVAAVTSAEIVKALRPVWTAKPSVADWRVRVCREVLKRAIGEGLRADNPTGAAVDALPKRKARTQHRKAIPHREASAAYRRLAGCVNRTRSQRVTALAVRFVMLTVARGGEVAGATWSEIDGDTWTVPSDRMKAAAEHRVPLSGEALAVLDAVAKITGRRSGLIFPSSTGRIVASSTFAKTLRRCEVNGTPHGMRTTFANWAREEGVSRDLIDRALAHREKGVQAAYFRSDLLEQRRPLMESYGRYLDTRTG